VECKHRHHQWYYGDLLMTLATPLQVDVLEYVLQDCPLSTILLNQKLHFDNSRIKDSHIHNVLVTNRRIDAKGTAHAGTFE